jgi:molybdenum cofactor biosynthesis protein B
LSTADSTPLEHKATAPRTVGCWVLTVSDTKTPETDTSGALIRKLLTDAGHPVVGSSIA